MGANNKQATDVWMWIRRGEPGECWTYRGRPTTNGHGQFMFKGVRHQAHRFVYELENGPIPEGLVIDHACHNLDITCKSDPCPHRMCCNPAHLEAVTQEENVNRSHRHKANRTHCPQGHPYSADNTRVGKSGSRYCKSCNSEDSRRRELLKKLPFYANYRD